MGRFPIRRYTLTWLLRHGQLTSYSFNRIFLNGALSFRSSVVCLNLGYFVTGFQHVVGSLFGLKKCNSTIESVLYGVLNVCIKHGSNEDATDNTSSATGAATTWSRLSFSTRCVVANRLIGVLFSSQYVSYLHQWNSRTKKRRLAQGSGGEDDGRQNDAPGLDTTEDTATADNDKDDTDDDPQLWQSFANVVNDDSSPLHSSLLEPHGDAHVFKQTFQEILESDAYQAELAHLPLSLAATAAAASNSSSGEVTEPNIAWQELRRLYDDLVVVQTVMLQNLPTTVPPSDCNMILFADWARTYTNMTHKLSNLNALYFFAQCMSHKLNYSGLERTKNAMVPAPAPVVLPMAHGVKKKPMVIDMTVRATTAAASSTATTASVAAAAAASAPTASTTVKQHIGAVSSNLHASRSDHEDAAFAKSMKKMLAEESNRWDNRIATLLSDHGTSGQSGTEKHVALQARIDTHVRLLHMAQKREVQYTKLYMKASSRKKASGNGESGTGVTTTENDSTFVDELQAKMKDAAYRVQRYQVELDTLQAQQQSHVQQEQQMTNHAAGAMPSSSPSTATGGPSIQQWSIPLMNRKRGANHLSSI